VAPPTTGLAEPGGLRALACVWGRITSGPPSPSRASLPGRTHEARRTLADALTRGVVMGKVPGIDVRLCPPFGLRPPLVHGIGRHAEVGRRRPEVKQTRAQFGHSAVGNAHRSWPGRGSTGLGSLSARVRAIAPRRAGVRHSRDGGRLRLPRSPRLPPEAYTRRSQRQLVRHLDRLPVGPDPNRG